METLLKKLGLSQSSQSIQVVPNPDLNQLAFTPEEGFLLSRIDVTSSLDDLLRISPFPKEKTIQMLVKFSDLGIVIAKSVAPLPEAAKPKDQEKTSPKDTPSDYFQEINAFYDRLRKNKNLSPAEVLGISRSSSLKEIKKSYVQLSKKFHPDRIFRKGQEEARKKVQFVFQQVNQAYQTLKEKRKPLSSHPSKSKKDRKVDDALVKRIAQANRLVRDSKGQKDPVMALNTLRLALQIDPKHKEANELLNKLEPRAKFIRAAPLFQRAQELDDLRVYDKAAKAYSEAADGDPGNVDYQRVCGEFLLYKRKDKERAFAYAKRAVVLKPKSIENLRLLGGCYKALKRFKEALATYEKVLELDKDHPFAKNEIREIKKSIILFEKKQEM